jgi:hypothetical protein
VSKTKNQRIWSSDQEYLRRVASEFEFIGRKYKLETGLLTIFALPQRKDKKKKSDKEPRNKRAESAGRRNND